MALCRLIELSQTFRKSNCLHLKDINSLTTGRLGTETVKLSKSLFSKRLSVTVTNAHFNRPTQVPSHTNQVLYYWGNSGGNYFCLSRLSLWPFIAFLVPNRRNKFEVFVTPHNSNLETLSYRRLTLLETPLKQSNKHVPVVVQNYWKEWQICRDKIVKTAVHIQGLLLNKEHRRWSCCHGNTQRAKLIKSYCVLDFENLIWPMVQRKNCRQT